jgi:hypothetical protein
VQVQVSLRYWSFALYFISQPQNRSKLVTAVHSASLSSAAHNSIVRRTPRSSAAASATSLLTSRDDEVGDDAPERCSDGCGEHTGGLGLGDGLAVTARTRARDTFASYDENQVHKFSSS